MPEPLTSHLVTTELQRLLAAFPRNLGAQNVPMMADVYKSGLRGLDGDALRGAVDHCIQTDNYFPKVARLREAAAEWRKRHRPMFAPVIRAAWNVCGICGAKAYRPMVTRPKRYTEGERGFYVVAKEYRTEVSHYPVGTRIPARDVIDAQSRGIVLQMETVQSDRDVMNHNADAHHIRPESMEEEGAA